MVLRNFGDLPGDMGDEEHGDIDIQVEDFDEAVFIADAKPATDTPGRVFMHVNVADRDVPFDNRHLGDDYYDRLWQRDILDNRVLADGGFYIPAPDDHFYSLLYHAVIHKPQVAADYLVTLTGLAQSLGRAEASPAHFTEYRWMMGLLNQFFRARGYEFTEPKDPSVYVNRRVLGDSPEAMENRFQIILEATLMTPPRHAKRNQQFFTRVWRMTMPDGSETALKLIYPLSVEARPLLFREHEFLERLPAGPFVRHLAHGELNGNYFLLTRWIEGFDLRPSPELDALLADANGRARLKAGCRDMAAGLKGAGMQHRDIREMNILIEDGAPVLIDFGWSVMDGENNMYRPENLEEPDDGLAMEQMLDRVLGR